MSPVSKKTKRNKRKTSVPDLDEKETFTSNRISMADEIDEEHILTAPKKKKRKKDESAENSTSDKNVSIRQMKREKHAQRVAEVEAAAHKTVQMQALSYLSLWKYNKAEWKFNKVKQIWLHKHKFEADKIPEELWPAFIEYFSGSSGGIKQVVIQDSKKVIDEMETWIENNKDSETQEAKPSELAYKRARDLLQNIQE